jgi:hypothetical protein
MRWAIVAVAGLLAGGAGLPLAGEVAQSGAQSGIGTTLFSAWLPAGLSFGGLSGTVSFSGNDPTFSEALVLLGTTGDGAAACAQRNNTAIAGFPALRLLWATILKSNDTTRVTVLPQFALPFAVAMPPQGACLMAVVSAGYPFLTATVSRYTDTSFALNILTPPATPDAQAVVPLGIGGEFRFNPVQMAGGTVYVGFRAEKPLVVDAIAPSVSAAPVLGAPRATGNLPLPSGGWAAGAPFYFLSARICAASHLKMAPSTGTLSVLRNGTPALVPLPGGAQTVLTPWLLSTGTHAAQGVGFVAFPARRGWDGNMAAGDCLVSYPQVRPYNGGVPGVVDIEAQSTVYFRVLSGR